jgi:hypothetical protein
MSANQYCSGHRHRCSGFPNFANKTFANWAFANSESPEIYWRKYSGHSPIGENQEGILVKVQRTLSNCHRRIWMSVACVELGCEDASYWFPLPTKSIKILLAHKLHWRKSYWRNFGKPDVYLNVGDLYNLYIGVRWSTGTLSDTDIISHTDLTDISVQWNTDTPTMPKYSPFGLWLLVINGKNVTSMSNKWKTNGCIRS